MKCNPLYFILIFLFVLIREPALNLINNINKNLFEKNNLLEINILKDKNTFLENEYQKLIDFKNNIDISYNYTITNVIVNNYSFKNMIISGNNYEINSEVISEEGLIGIVSKINKNSSEVEYLYNTNIVVKINNDAGKIASKDKDNNLIIKELSNYNSVNINDKVYSAFNTYIGKVINIKKNDLDSYVIVKPAISDKPTYVAVIERKV